MVYSQYKQKLEKIVKALNVAWRFRYIILCGVILVLALILSLCAVSGSVYGESCPSSVEYGSSLNFEAKAVLAKATAEYRAAGQTEWTDEEPTAVGEYEVRAVSRGAFGVRHGDAFTYTITARAATLSYTSDIFAYGDDPETAASLAYSDALEEVDYEYNYLGDDMYEVTATVKSIVNENGDDVTSSYIIQSAVSRLTRVQREITISTGSASKTYDGTALSAKTYKITNGSLIGGQTITVDFSEYINAATYENRPEVTICDGEGNDVTHNYAITYISGSLEILQREITISTGSASKTYDGSAASPNSYIITSGTLVQGHQIDAEFSEFVNAGTYLNTPEIEIRDGAGNVLTDNYCFTFNSGTVEISPRAITVYTASAVWIYDGEKHSAASVGSYGLSDSSANSLLGGHTLLPTPLSVSANTITEITDSETKVGYHQNALKFTVTDGGENDVTANYEFSYEYGNLRIKSPIIISLYSYSKYYDGTALSFKGGFTVTKPPDVNVSCTVSTKSITNVGTVYSDEFSITGITVTDLSTGANVNSDNSWYIEESGDPVLEVKQRKIEVTSISVAQEKTGKTLTADSSWISVGSLVSGHMIAVTVTGELTVYEKSAVNTIESVVIYDAYGNDVTSNYYITLSEGTLQWLS